MTPPQAAKVSNFDFLAKQWPDLAQLAHFAETYAYTDPASSAVKLRIFAERFVDVLYYELGIQKPAPPATFKELLSHYDFKKAVPNQIVSFLHLIRKEGNIGAHERKARLSPQDVIKIIKSVHTVSIWLYKTVVDTELQFAPFEPPQKQPDIQELLANQAELEKQIEVLQKAQEEERAENPIPETTDTEKEEIITKATVAAETVGLTEAETRKQLIDMLLKEAGWTVLEGHEAYQPGSDKPQALPEYPVAHQPTTSGTGFIDYVLMGSNGKPVAIIEAKKTARSADEGQAQAKLYADGLEKDLGQRPFIFYTNGHDIYFWDDMRYPPRRVWGYFDLAKLEYMLLQRVNKKPLNTIEINTSITERNYQLECIRRVYESFEDDCRRKALIVMATGTGKTRVAVSLIDGLMRAGWVKRVLFLADRKELRKQAFDAFKEHLPSEKAVILTGANKNEQDARIYLATYQTMIEAYTSFNIGFFDLIVADESHRSIYKSYRELFQYFDTLQVGLTATPVSFINRNTFNFFELPTTDPTFHFSYEQAVEHKPPYLVPFVVDNESTEFLQRGMKDENFTEEQRQQLQEQDEEPETYDFEPEDMDSRILNKDTNKKFLENLMNKGLKDETGTKPGKTIIFARSHRHAVKLLEVFNELYPQYKGHFAQIIDSQVERSEELIDGFKGKKKEFKDLTIAISVDMLDTGIDVPEVTNLVFAKPVYSRVKFWQMIGRGTRLCPKCQNWCEHKSQFMIFDPWRNFEFFDLKPEGVIPTEQKSLTERLFSARLALLQAAKGEAFYQTVQALLQADVNELDDKTVSVRENWRVVERVKQDGFWQKLTERSADDSFKLLAEDIAPLMRWRNILGEADALYFDNKIARLQLALLKNNSDQFEQYQEEVIADIERLRLNLNQVKKEEALILAMQKAAWWQDITLEKLEDARLRLRALMKYRQSLESFKPKTIDVVDYTVEGQIRMPNLPESMEAYKARLQMVLKDLMSNNLTLQKIHRARPITEAELDALLALIMERDSSLKRDELEKLYPQESPALRKFIQSLIGMDELTVHTAFENFQQSHTTLSANQMQFLSLIQQEIIKSGGLEVTRLYEDPFTRFHIQGLDGLFKPEEVDEILSIIEKLGA